MAENTNNTPEQTPHQAPEQTPYANNTAEQTPAPLPNTNNTSEQAAIFNTNNLLVKISSPNEIPAQTPITNHVSSPFLSTKAIARKPLALRIILGIVKTLWRGLCQIPKIYDGMVASSHSVGAFLQTHRILIRKIIFTCILIVLGIAFYFYYQYQQQLSYTRQVQHQILIAEAWLIHGQYEQAQPLYKDLTSQNLAPDTKIFLQNRLEIIEALLRLNSAVNQGDLNEVETLLNQISPSWQAAHRELFLAHSKNFKSAIDKLRQYQKNASEILIKLKEGKLAEAETLLQHNLALTKNAERAFLPLKLEIMKGISQGYPAMLIMAWKYRTPLQLDFLQFREGLGKDKEEQLVNAEKMLQNYQPEVAQILAQILTTQDSQTIAKNYIADLTQFSDEIQLKRLEIALYLDPLLDQAYAYRAQWYRQHKQYAQALQDYQAANNIHTAYMLVQQGWCYNEQRDWPQTQNAWRKALESQPNYSDASVALAQLSWILQNHNQTKQNLAVLPQQNLNLPAQWIQSWLQGSVSTNLEDNFPNTIPTMHAYWLLGYAIALDQAGYTQQSLQLSQIAYSVLKNADIPAWEVLIYQALWAEKLEATKISQDAVEELSRANTPQGRICYAMYCQAKQIPPPDLSDLPAPWQDFWRQNNLDQFSYSRQ